MFKMAKKMRDNVRMRMLSFGVLLFAMTCLGMTPFESQVITLQNACMKGVEVNAAVPASELVKQQTCAFATKCLAGSTLDTDGFSLLYAKAPAAIGKVTAQSADGVRHTLLSWVTDRIKRPLLVLSEGYAVQSGATLAQAKAFALKETLRRTKGAWCVAGVDQVLDAESCAVKNTFSGKAYCVPFARFWALSIDDRPGNNWGHPCRYVLVKDDLSAFVTWYENAPMAVVDAAGNVMATSVWQEAPMEKVDAVNIRKIARNAISKMNDVETNVTSEIEYSGLPGQSYALLISGGSTRDQNYSRYWGDVAMFYNTLRHKYGLAKDHIRVYISDGTSVTKDQSYDGTAVNSSTDLDNDNVADVTGAATKSSIKNGIVSLVSKLTADDQLFVFVTDHGYRDDDTGAVFLVPWLGYNAITEMSENMLISPSEFASWFSTIKAPTAFAFEFCYSGAFIDVLKKQDFSVIATACASDENSAAYCFSDPEGSKTVVYDPMDAFLWCNPWAFAFNSAIRGIDSVFAEPWNDNVTERRVDSADANGDNLVSFQEAADTAKRFILNETRVYGDKTLTFGDNPQYGESIEGLGNKLFVLKQVSAMTYFVRYQPGTKGTGDATIQLKPEDETIQLRGAIFTRAGYTQTGWSRTDGGTIAYELGENYSKNSNTTLYPFWTADTPLAAYGFPSISELVDTAYANWQTPLFLSAEDPSSSYAYTPITDFKKGDTPYFCYLVKNRGNTDITTMAVKYEIYTSAGTVAASTRSTIANMPKDSLVPFQMQWAQFSYLAVGSYKLRVTLDPDNSDTTDHIADYAFTVSSSGEDPTPITITLPAVGGSDSGHFTTKSAGTYIFDGSEKPDWVTDYKVSFSAGGTSQSFGPSAEPVTVTFAADTSVNISVTANTNASGVVRIWNFPITFPAGGVLNVVVSQASISPTPTPKTLTGVTISGSSSVSSGNTAQYVCTARYSDGSTSRVTPVWSVTSGSTYASIDSTGLLTARETTSSQAVTIKAVYTEGASVTDSFNLTITPKGIVPEWEPQKKLDVVVLYARIYDEASKSYLEDADSILGVFAADGECRGKTTITDGPVCKLFSVSIAIESSAETGFVVKYFSSARGIIELEERVDASDAVDRRIGGIAAPKIFTITSKRDISWKLEKGWNWVSLNVAPEDPSVSAVLTNCVFADEDIIMTESGSAAYAQGKWYPSSDDFVFEAGKAYMVKRSIDGTLTVNVSGSPVDANIPVNAGWNWIGVTSAESVYIQNVSHSAGFSNDDMINSSSANITYYDSRWYGDGVLTTLVPGVGYKARLGKAGTLYFGQEASANGQKKESLDSLGNDALDKPTWVRTVKEDAVVGYFVITNANVTLQNPMLGVFAADGECRGTSELSNGPKGKLFQMTISVGDLSENGFVARVYDSGTGKIYDINEVINPGTDSSDHRIGTLTQPVPLSVKTSLPDPDPIIPVQVIAFDDSDYEVDGGDTLVIMISGGSTNSDVSVQVQATYLTAKASHFDLTKACVYAKDNESDAVSGVKFPLTLKWTKGDVRAKVIEIPVKELKATDVTKYMSLQLASAQGMEIGDAQFARVAIAGNKETDNVYVQAACLDSTQGKVSGSAIATYNAVRDSYKTVTLKASAAKGWWFAGWVDEYGEFVSGDLSFKVTPEDAEGIVTYFAQFVKADTSFAGTYNGYARLCLRGMSLVKDLVTDENVYGDYASTFTLSEAGKLSGSVTIGGKRATLKGEACYEMDDGEIAFLATVDEKAWFGVANTEFVLVRIFTDGMANLEASDFESDSEYMPLSDTDSSSVFYKDVSKNASLAQTFSVFAGQYVGAFTSTDQGVIPVSMTVDAKGKVKCSGYYRDGKSFTVTGQLGGYVLEPATYSSAFVDLCFTPKSLGFGSCHLNFTFTKEEGDEGTMVEFSCVDTSYTSTLFEETDWARGSNGSAMPYSTGCWIPQGEWDLDYAALVLSSDAGENVTNVINVLCTSKNGAITGLGKAVESGVKVKFDAKTGLLTVTKDKSYTLLGYLGADGAMAFGRVNTDGSYAGASGAFGEIDKPQENIPAEGETVTLQVGVAYSDNVSVVSPSGEKLALAVSGLPSGLTYNKTTGDITGSPKRAGSYTVKFVYAYAGKKITRTVLFVVEQ